MTLPSVWRSRFGTFASVETVELQTATQELVKGPVCGPVKITIEGFGPIYNEGLFLDMKTDDDEYEPLLGYIALEQCGAAVDMLGHRLIPVKYVNVK